MTAPTAQTGSSFLAQDTAFSEDPLPFAFQWHDLKGAVFRFLRLPGQRQPNA
jgi:hypothetical protein